MVNFAEWAKNASTFLRGLTYLPGRIEIADEIEPPANEDYHRAWLASDDCSLPPEIVRFLASASRRCFFLYRWSPPPDLRQALSDLFPGQETLIGGGDFCEGNCYSSFEKRDQLAGLLGPTLLGSLGWDRMEVERSRGYLRLMALPNGDTISLQLDPAGGTRCVSYLPADPAAEPRVLSPSFEQFLLDWQQLSYIQPSLEFLAPWLDSASGRLNADCEATAALKDLLAHRLANQLE